MKSYFGDKKVTIACPHCGEKITRPLKWFSEGEHQCPQCGATFKPDATRQTQEVNGEADKPKQGSDQPDQQAEN